MSLTSRATPPYKQMYMLHFQPKAGKTKEMGSLSPQALPQCLTAFLCAIKCHMEETSVTMSAEIELSLSSSGGISCCCGGLFYFVK